MTQPTYSTYHENAQQHFPHIDCLKLMNKDFILVGNLIFKELFHDRTTIKLIFKVILLSIVNHLLLTIKLNSCISVTQRKSKRIVIYSFLLVHIASQSIDCCHGCNISCIYSVIIFFLWF